MTANSGTIEVVELTVPADVQLILGQAHFILTVESLFRAIACGAPGSKFGLAFSEASGDRKVRTSGNDDELKALAAKHVMTIGSGHCFLVLLSGSFPIQVLNNIKSLPTVANIFCASGNPVQALVYRTSQGGAIIGVVDGESPVGIEDEEDVKARQKLLQNFGYSEPMV